LPLQQKNQNKVEKPVMGVIQMETIKKRTPQIMTPQAIVKPVPIKAPKIVERQEENIFSLGNSPSLDSVVDSATRVV